MDFLALNNPWQSCLLLLVTIPSLKCMSQLFVSPQASQEPPCLALPPLVTFFLTCLWLLQSQHLQPHHIQLLPASSQAEVASQPKPSPLHLCPKTRPCCHPGTSRGKTDPQCWVFILPVSICDVFHLKKKKIFLALTSSLVTAFSSSSISAKVLVLKPMVSASSSCFPLRFLP